MRHLASSQYFTQLKPSCSSLVIERASGRLFRFRLLAPRLLLRSDEASREAASHAAHQLEIEIGTGFQQRAFGVEHS